MPNSDSKREFPLYFLEHFQKLILCQKNNKKTDRIKEKYISLENQNYLKCQSLIPSLSYLKPFHATCFFLYP